MRPLRSFHLVLMVVTGIFATPLLWMQDEVPGSPRFEQLDRNGDGYLSLAELGEAAVYFHPFRHADHDRDGLLSLLEFEAALDAPPVQR